MICIACFVFVLYIFFFFFFVYCVHDAYDHINKCIYAQINMRFTGWRRGLVVRTSVFDWRTFLDLSVFPFLPRHYHMTRVLRLPLITTAWTHVVLAIINII